jgi:hypothetical protein
MHGGNRVSPVSPLLRLSFCTSYFGSRRAKPGSAVQPAAHCSSFGVKPPGALGA